MQTPSPAATGNNPLLSPSPLPFGAPPFDKIKDADFEPAFEEGMRQQLAEIEAIANNPAPPTFDNTLVALEKSGQTADARAAWSSTRWRRRTPNRRCRSCRKTSRRSSPRTQDAIFLNAKLFARDRGASTTSARR